MWICFKECSHIPTNLTLDMGVNFSDTAHLKHPSFVLDTFLEKNCLTSDIARGRV